MYTVPRTEPLRRLVFCGQVVLCNSSAFAQLCPFCSSQRPGSIILLVCLFVLKFQGLIRLQVLRPMPGIVSQVWFSPEMEFNLRAVLYNYAFGHCGNPRESECPVAPNLTPSQRGKYCFCWRRRWVLSSQFVRSSRHPSCLDGWFLASSIIYIWMCNREGKCEGGPRYYLSRKLFDLEE